MKLAALLAAAIGASIVVTTPPRPPFPGPVTSAPDAKRLVVVSSRKISPGLGGPAPSCVIEGVPESMRGLPHQRSFCFRHVAFALYGKDGASSRLLLGVGSSGPRYAYDFVNYVWPPNIRPGERGFVYEEVIWAYEAGGVLYVEHAHPTYARSSYGQNAYITAFDLQTWRRQWRSKALVANARTFLVTPRYLVTGYGFTAEDDWLYLLDRATGRVIERLKLPSAPERITRTGSLITVRTYDHVVTVRLKES